MECFYKGRNMPDLTIRSEQLFEDLLSTAQRWDDSDFAGNATWRSQANGATKLVVTCGRRKFEFARTVPWLFSRLEEPGVAAECLRQWAAAPAPSHHPFTRQVLQEGCELRGLVESIPPEGQRPLPAALSRSRGAQTSQNPAPIGVPDSRNKSFHDNFKHVTVCGPSQDSATHSGRKWEFEPLPGWWTRFHRCHAMTRWLKARTPP